MFRLTKTLMKSRSSSTTFGVGVAQFAYSRNTFRLFINLFIYLFIHLFEVLKTLGGPHKILFFVAKTEISFDTKYQDLSTWRFAVTF